MLSINWDDVAKLVESIKFQLIAIGVILLVALLVTIAVRKLSVPKRKLTRATTWVAALVAVAVAFVSMLYGGFKTVLDLASGSGVLTDETKASVEKLGNEISDEGMVLLKNSEDTLPLAADSKVNVWGWASTNPIYGGTGSGSLNPDNPTTSLIDGLHNAGFQTNDELTKFYMDFREDRPEIGMFQADWSLPEPTKDMYSDSLISNVTSYSDTAIVTIARSGGEGFDLPQDVNKEVKENGAFSYTNNSKEYADFEDGQGYLELTRPEKDMIELAKSASDKVVVVVNAANAFQLGELNDDPEIDAIVWAIPGGQVGFNALGRILDGEVNPSAKTPDTFARTIKNSPAAKNFGNFGYTNMKEYGQDDPFSDNTTYPSFVNYVEGIYVGYRWYETAAEEGVINYDDEVVYPFGYGLSYTTFEQKMGNITRADGKISFDVTVTNTGDVAGKDVVQAYYSAPYTNGGIEKASVNLADYAKTSLLEPGASETVTISFNEDEMASYDSVNAKAYVLEAGDYTVSIRENSHTEIDSSVVTVDETVVYNSEDMSHAGDRVPATNQFDQAAGDVTYLSRANGFANRDQATAAPTNFEMSKAHQDAFVANSNYKAEKFNDEADEMPTTGAKNGLVLGDMYGLDYDDPKWEQLLDQLSVDDMDSLVANGGYGSVAVKSVGKVRVSDVDGPASLNNNFTGVGSIGLPAAVSVAATFNKEIAKDFGEAIGTMAHDMDVAGWYAPATNTHRYAYAGRNFEYFSEDPMLAGTQVAQEIQGAAEHGVYAFVKHFALNDQETNRTHMLATWANEQSIREIYLRPFEIGIKEGGAHGVMTAFNYIGTVYAGALPELQQNVLRGEWGFQGMTLTDYFAGYGYQNMDQLTRNGGDMALATLDLGVNHVKDRSATGVKALRTSAHNILYTVANSWIYEDGQPKVERAAWEYIAWGGLALIVLVALGLEVLAIKRYRIRRAESTVSVEPAADPEESGLADSSSRVEE
ncbi:glycoside hydrolase family 3 C-terminal domain-containing protein [Schaalia sp. ZJ405]|uniref:glycoside hydrolase family 3 C-terminal domain-containing protein n=1 Tax=Schaalia sp. ZJ405 TaxID=2709403 RepID=UPI0013EC5C87|nr:glycoside hydrolase family 3 C-terminal domain-containing protein [Schaalia sp. ZJ405]QPK80999.1 glycoside hydrolase family 3 C-terminal domain-containing protein [Schaalia sp. ZJ405]